MEFIINFLQEVVVATVFIAVFILAYSFYIFKIKEVSFKDWKKSEGKGAIASALLGVGSTMLLAGILTILVAIFNPVKAESFSESLKGGTWFNETSVYLGIDYTAKTSPQCVRGISDDRGTSNLGILQNIWMSKNKNFAWNFKYTHHSCVIGKDRNGYDGAGLQLVWYIRH
jgi:hypothetical protein